MATNLLSMPLEIKLQILENLDIKSIDMVSHTCRELNQFVTANQKYLPKLKQISLQCDAFNLQFTESSDAVTTLSCDNLERPLKLLSRCRFLELELIAIDSESLQKIGQLDSVKTVESLKINASFGWNVIRCRNLKWFLSQMTKLNTLRISGYWDNGDLTELIKGMASVRIICGGVHAVNDETLKAISAKSSASNRIKCVDFSKSISRITKEGIIDFINTGSFEKDAFLSFYGIIGSKQEIIDSLGLELPRHWTFSNLYTPSNRRFKWFSCAHFSS